MAITPDEIENRVFGLVRRGYDPAEVDDFLKEVAATVAQVQGRLATPAASAPAKDDFGRLGEEVAAVLRQAHESVATLRHRAEAEAALIRQTAAQEVAVFREAAEWETSALRQAVEHEAAALRAEAEADRTQAARIREVAEAEVAAKLAEVAAKLAEVERRIEGAAQAAADEARMRAREAVMVQRNVRGRLEGTRGDIDTAIERLVGEDHDLFSAIDLTELDEAEGDVPPPGQGAPSAAVAPPAGQVLDLTNLPYADPDSEIEAGEDTPTLPPVENSNGKGDGDGERVAAELPGGPDRPDEGDPLDAIVRSAVEDAVQRKEGDQSTDDG